MVFRFLILVHVCAAFQLKCPEPAQWSLRARSHCPDPSKYFCLKNDLIKGYSENCTVFDFLQPGRKNILRGGLDADICSSERYQPWPIKFYTNVSTNCIFLKFTCSEEGQVVYDIGNRNTDTTCKCDYTRGYDFLIKPQHLCYCNPSEEDCSCYLKTCPDSTFTLSPDYECIFSRMNLSMTKCRPIMNERDNKDKKSSQTQYISRTDNISSPVLWKKYAEISTFVFCIGLILVFCGNELLEKYYRNAYFILKPAGSITIIEGTSVSLEYKLLVNRFAYDFKRNNFPIGEASNICRKEAGRSKILTITPIALTDDGEYCMEAACIKSKPTRLIVKPLFKHPLKVTESAEGLDTVIKCETEKEDSAVEWFKGDIQMTDNMEKQETEKGYIYKLRIKHTSVHDNGTYRIEKNGFCSEATLEIKALFKEPLKDIKSVEGSRAIFECETEKEDGDVEWFKDDIKMTYNTEKFKTEQGYIYKLTIKHTSAQDSGTYRIEKNGIRSEAVLEVKALFRRPLKNETIMEGLDIQFECETEEENSAIEWFKDDVLITLNTGNAKMETLVGNIYKLIISPARLQDSGRYRIQTQTNGIFSEADLDVKEMPETIQQMSVHDREEFLKATQSGTTRRYYIRVMIVGESSAGKSCLLRRLMNEPIDDVISTDGLDIKRRSCQVDVNTGKWHFSTTDQDSYSIWSDQNKQFADCGFWDFAGQKEFYATHQTFLSANAVYLLVVDISKDFTTKTYNDMIKDKFDRIGEYIDFWLDSIHCYSTEFYNVSKQCYDNLELNPPVVIVGTGIDKIQLVERKNSQQNFLDHLSKVLSNHEKRRHLRKTHFLSNTYPSENGEEFKKLREDIFDKAKVFINWGDNLPTRWIVLEKEIHRKIVEEKYTMSYNEAIQLATKCSFPNLKHTTSELDSFLKYEHDIGNIIFFEDVKDFIVLDPKWLVDVFKCFVSNRYKNELINMTEWSELEKKGKLSNSLIVKLLEKVPHLSLVKHKQFVLQIMEKFDIIVKPRNDEASEIFYMPCMIKTATLNDIYRGIGAEKCKITTSWFMLEFDFLPPSYFAHILVSFVKEKRLWTINDKQLCIYRNIGLFDINDSRTRVLIICLSKNSIAMQVLQWNLEHHCYSDIKSKLIDLVCSLKLRYRMNITYKKKFKCSKGNCFEDEGRVDFDTVLAESEYRCTEHNDTHQSKDILKSWLTDKEIEEEYKNKGRSKCNYCENMSVYKCYDCNNALCKDCSMNHNDGKRYENHFMQPISDSFMLNCKFSVENYSLSGTFISDIKCLPNGELIVAVYGKPEVMTISLSGKKRHIIQLKAHPQRMDVVDKNTVAVAMINGSMALVDIQQNQVLYIRSSVISWILESFIYLEKQFYVANKQGINVFDMSGTEKRSIELCFTPNDMCYDVDSQRIYCIDNGNSELVCIDRDGNNLFTFADQNMTNLKNLTIDNEGNVLVMSIKLDHHLGCVFKVDSNGKSSEVVITNIKMSSFYSSICFNCLTTSVVIGVEDTVYIYQKEPKKLTI